ncbi:MFS transporter [Nonomuraea endophytica]|uniref:Putative MFS family arabinose efflux permease n=1 Tax=Nonomuraea endophytica TaxID=714136 RepID=A0A7W8EL10_9ACTN|nr:MFS transporter [Nonomuraea endophytica]MBB5084820.1 putative MFS family arabinose efflux permease [Nonomuraea endophytica]
MPNRSVTALLTAVMAVSMAQLFLVGALGPLLVSQAGVPRAVLGWTSTAGFAVAALLSLMAGHWVDRLGARRSVVALVGLAALALALIGFSVNTPMLLAALALGGLPQALANPATNKIIMVSVEPGRRGGVTGWKQSGVQLGALAAGLPLAALAAWLGWRGVMWTAAAIAVIIAVWAVRSLPDDTAHESTGPPDLPPARVGRLAVFSFLLGCGIAAVNTYVTLFGVQELGLAPVVAAWLVAVLGLAGVAGRVGWSRRADRSGRAPAYLTLLSAGACLAALMLGAATWAPGAIWVAAAATGAFAVAANAVTMVVVISQARRGAAGRDSARVSAGFFAGFAAGPPAFGALIDRAGYGPGWLLVAAEFAIAAVVAMPLRSRT